MLWRLIIEQGEICPIDSEIFGWADVEETAWTAYTWNLVRSIAPSITRPCLGECWGKATREPMREAMGAAKNVATQQLHDAYRGETRELALAGAKQWPTTQNTTFRKSDLDTLKPFARAFSTLHVCWCRQRYWNSQREKCRFRPFQRALAFGLQQNLAVHISTTLSQTLQLTVPVDMTCAALRSFCGIGTRSTNKGPKKGSSANVSVAPSIVPFQLPLTIVLMIGDVQTTCRLHSVRGLERQQVTIEITSGNH
jgi:hypothetical protein